jgi:hypothetical protein
LQDGRPISAPWQLAAPPAPCTPCCAPPASRHVSSRCRSTTQPCSRRSACCPRPRPPPARPERPAGRSAGNAAAHGARLCQLQPRRCLLPRPVPVLPQLLGQRLSRGQSLLPEHGDSLHQRSCACVKSSQRRLELSCQLVHLVTAGSSAPACLPACHRGSAAQQVTPIPGAGPQMPASALRGSCEPAKVQR